MILSLKTFSIERCFVKELFTKLDDIMKMLIEINIFYVLDLFRVVLSTPVASYPLCVEENPTQKKKNNHISNKQYSTANKHFF